MKKWIAFALIAALALALVGCTQNPADESGLSGSTPAESGALRVAALSDMTTMDVAQTTSDYFVPQNIFDRLFEVRVLEDGSTEIVHSLCKDHTVTPDGLTYTFNLVENATFSNGNPLTASDVAYTFYRLLTAGGVNDDIALEVVGAQALKDGAAQELSGITVTGEYQLTVTLNAPNAGFLAELTAPAMSIVDEETCKSAENFGMSVADTIGSGPYIITEWVPNDHITLVRNETYWGEKPSVEKVIKYIIPDANTQNLMFQNGELDMIDLDNLDASIVTNTYQTNYASQLISGRRVGLTYVAMNQDNEFLANPLVRKAIQMAVSRDVMLQSVYAGAGSLENGIIPAGVWGHNEALSPIVYDPAQAQQLLTQAGFAPGQITLELSMDNTATSATQMLYQILQQDLQNIGIDAQIKSYDQSAWLDKRNSGSMEMYISTWTMDYNDPANIMATFFGSAEKTKLRSLNYPGSQVLDRVAAASSIVDDSQRMAEYQALEQQIVQEDAAWVPLFERAHQFAVSSRVSSYTPHWAGYSDFYVKDVTLK